MYIYMHIKYIYMHIKDEIFISKIWNMPYFKGRVETLTLYNGNASETK